MYLNSSIAKKQIVALTGLLLILFIITHLAGNLLIYAGPTVFNAYAHRLHSLGPLLLIARSALLTIFLIHISLTFLLVWDNIKARGGHRRYEVDGNKGNRSWTQRIMPWTGLYIFMFVLFHVLDFAAADQQGPRTYINGTSYGLYGLVFNSFRDPIHGILYIVAMCFIAMHLSHGVQSLVQTSGFRPKWQDLIGRISNYFAILMAFGFSSIPVYVYYLSR